MTPKYFTSSADSHIVPLMKLSDKLHCLLTEGLKNKQTDFLALNLGRAVGSIQYRYSTMIIALMKIKK